MLISAILYKYNQDFVDLYKKVGAEKAIRFFALRVSKFNTIDNYAEMLESRLRSLDEKTLKTIVQNIKEGKQLIPVHIPPFRAAKYNDLIQLAINAGVLELKTINCPELGRKIKAFVGYIYFYRLEHMAINKMNARSTGVYRYKTRQPVSGKKEIGGQNIDEQQTWAAIAHDVPNLMEELKTVQSDEFEYKDKVIREIMEGKEPTLPKLHRKTAIQQMYQALMTGLHIQI
jgi:DNA-directed RNA polymerase beta subunit